MNRDTFARFPNTSWTMIRAVNDVDEDERRRLLEPLLKRYWRPVYAFFRAKGMTTNDAEDAVQGLFVRLMSDRKMLEVAPDRGRFRDWIRACAKNHMTSLLRKQNAKKRAPDQPVASLDLLKSDTQVRFEPSIDDSPDEAFSDIWRRDLIDGALMATEQTCRQTGRELDFAIFCAYHLTEKENRKTLQQLADQYGLRTFQEAARKAYSVKLEFGEAIRDEIRRYADTESEVDDEIRSILN